MIMTLSFDGNSDWALIRSNGSKLNPALKGRMNRLSDERRIHGKFKGIPAGPGRHPGI